jgi:type IV pilus assembly protein PilV
MKNISNVHSQTGSGLLEVLVAVLVLSLGLLGLAGLQARTLQQNHSSLQRSQAVMLSYSILDSLRADRQGAMLGNYNIGQTCVAPALNGNLVNDTISIWISSIQNRLGANATSCGSVACAASGICTVRIFWDDSRAGGSANETFETRSQI